MPLLSPSRSGWWPNLIAGRLLTGGCLCNLASDSVLVNTQLTDSTRTNRYYLQFVSLRGDR